MADSMAEIAELLEHTKFKSRLFGGVDEADVWKKLGRLQREYMDLCAHMEERYRLRTAEWSGYAAALEKQLAACGKVPDRPAHLQGVPHPAPAADGGKEPE